VTEITDHLADIHKRVASSLRRAGRSDQVTVVAVSKRHSSAHIAAAYRAGQKDFGESYVQEALAKMDALRDLPITWHFIGPIQANKTRAIAERFAWVHSVDRPKVVQRLAEQRPYHAAPLNTLIQVNLAGELQKAGVAVSDVPELARLVGSLPSLKLRGLMGIPPVHYGAREVAEFYRSLADLLASLSSSGYPMDTLSMGMSNDFETAIENGSTCVRIGTAIFGRRPM
jgi:PLP dependent protein